MKPGIHQGIASEVYHLWPFASSTAIKALMRSSPAHAKAGIVDSDSPALRLGTAVHAAILEPAKFDGLIRIEPKFDRRTKEGKALAESFDLSMMPGQTRITEEQFAVVRAIENAVRSSRACTSVLGMARQRELSVVAEVEGVMCKCRCDAYGVESGVLVDVKTTSGLASHDEFARTMWNLQYATQAAFYRMVMSAAGLPLERFAWIVCETNQPHGVACYEVSPSTLDLFEPAIIVALRRWSDCETSGTWPAYPDEVQVLEMPSWMHRQLEGG